MELNQHQQQPKITKYEQQTFLKFKVLKSKQSDK